MAFGAGRSVTQARARSPSGPPAGGVAAPGRRVTAICTVWCGRRTGFGAAGSWRRASPTPSDSTRRPGTRDPRMPSARARSRAGRSQVGRRSARPSRTGCPGGFPARSRPPPTPASGPLGQAPTACLRQAGAVRDAVDGQRQRDSRRGRTRSAVSGRRRATTGRWASPGRRVPCSTRITGGDVNSLQDACFDTAQM